jgi:tetratricopeptide (TPR) repeat protein
MVVFVIAVLAIFVASGVVIRLLIGSGQQPESIGSLAAPRKPAFVGSKACGSCHATEFKAWQGSHHQLAMQPATNATVLGDFTQVKFVQGKVTTTFFRDGDNFMVHTDGPDGAMHDYQVKFTFGVFPLQQYLIGLPGGRLQAFTMAWDSRPRGDGGQRWFALYPESGNSPSSPTHWTAIDQTWNYMCADCHSTDVHKNYDAATRTYATTYAEIDVGCEGCHGPGGDHLAWAALPRDRQERDRSQGLTIRLDERAGVVWATDPRTGEVRRSAPRETEREIQMCARCHSRRGQIHESYVHGQPVGDDYHVALLDDALYFPDGQIKGEVYEYGSFIQSRMFHQGVTCSDCHDPHDAAPRAKGNGLCTRCHLQSKYDTPRHYFHPAGSAGARCVECHMPTRTYMIVDPRRDHSIRVPRPDLSGALGTPNACNNCHTDKSPQWAADAITKWYGPHRIGFQQFGAAILAGRMGAPGASTMLSDLIRDQERPAIARATALELLVNMDSNLARLRSSADDKSALVRRSAAEMLSATNPEANTPAMYGLLDDPVRAVRIQAAQSLAGVAPGALPEQTTTEFEQASAEYLSAQALNADRPETYLNLATYFAKEKKIDRAEAELRTGLAIDPSFGPAAVNLADLLRETGRDDEAETVLRQASRRMPDDASVLFSLGLLEVRKKQNAQALELLGEAARLDPSQPRYAYVYAIALNEAGSTREAIEVLEQSLKRNPYYRDSLAALVSFCERTGDHAKAQEYAKVLKETDTGAAVGASPARE